MKKIVKSILGFLAIVLVVLVYAGWASDIEHDELVAKYGTGTSQFIELPMGAKAHYRDIGPADATPILLIHGSNATLQTWEAWAAELSKTYRVITVDMPGHGLTGAVTGEDYKYSGMVRFLEDFTTATGLTEFIMGGNSMGGGITASYTLAHPEQVTALIMVDAAGVFYKRDANKKTPLGFTLAATPVLNKIMTKVTPRSLIRQGIERSYYDDSLITEELVDQYWELLRHPGNRSATALRFHWYATDPQNLNAEAITQPVLIIWGSTDLIIPIAAGHEWHRRLPNSEMVILDKAGHNPMEEIPTRSLIPVRAFLDKINAEKSLPLPDVATTGTDQLATD